MKAHFDDPLFDAQYLRTLSHIYYGGADIGEGLSTAQRIPSGDREAWEREWTSTAQRLHGVARECLAADRLHSAQEAFLRAANYYRTAYLFEFHAPVSERLRELHALQVETFRQACSLFSPAIEPVSIPYEVTSLPGYFLPGSSSSGKTLVLVGGYDSTAEELFFFAARAASQRGYNTLFFDGPGQGAALIQQGLVMRPDWENVLSPVIDYAISRPEVSADNIAVFGLSLGGYLAPRAASHEPRLAACIADAGQLNLFGHLLRLVPSPLKEQLASGDFSKLEGMRATLEAMAASPRTGWTMQRNFLVHGISDPIEFVRQLRDFSFVDTVKNITCPTLVISAENDALGLAADELFDHLVCPRERIVFTSEDGAGEHCEQGNRSLANQRIFDWLDRVLDQG